MKAIETVFWISFTNQSETFVESYDKSIWLFGGIDSLNPLWICFKNPIDLILLKTYLHKKIKWGRSLKLTPYPLFENWQSLFYISLILCDINLQRSNLYQINTLVRFCKCKCQPLKRQNTFFMCKIHETWKSPSDDNEIIKCAFISIFNSILHQDHLFPGHDFKWDWIETNQINCALNVC